MGWHMASPRPLRHTHATPQAGNDFLPHVPSVDIYDLPSGLDLLLAAYKALLPTDMKGYITQVRHVAHRHGALRGCCTLVRNHAAWRCSHPSRACANRFNLPDEMKCT